MTIKEIWQIARLHFLYYVEWKALLVIYGAVLQEGSRTTLKQLPRGPGADGVSLVLSSTPLALRVGRRRSWAVGMLNLRKPQGKCKRARYGSLPSGVLWSSNDEGRLPPTGQVPGSPQAGLTQPERLHRERRLHGAASRPTLCSQTKTLNLFPTDYFPDLNVFPLQEYDLES